MKADSEHDNEEHQEGDDDVNDPLKCKLGGEFLKWGNWMVKWQVTCMP